MIESIIAIYSNEGIWMLNTFWVGIMWEWIICIKPGIAQFLSSRNQAFK